MLESKDYWKGRAEGYQMGVEFAMKINVALNTSVAQRIREEKKMKKVIK